MQGIPLVLSQTVESVRKELRKKKSVFPIDIIKAILNLHPEYGKRSKHPSFTLLDQGLPEPIDDWISEIRYLFDPFKASRLNGRMVIIGLGISDPDLRKQLNQNSFFDTLINELTEPLDQILSDAGLKLFDSFQQSTIDSSKQESNSDSNSSEKNEKQKNKKPHETKTSKKSWSKILSSDRIGSYSDSPESKIEDDKLGRAAYARYLVQRILAVETEVAFSVHIGGSWGSGKSTLLNFMQKEFELNTEYDWSIVKFNAWQNQHTNPPWWPLLDAVYQKSKRHLNFWDKRCEYFWRLRMGRSHVFFVVFLVAATVFGLLFLIHPENFYIETVLKIIKGAGTVIAAMVGLWAGFQGVSSILMSRSSQAAKNYLSTTTNPMMKISESFETLIERVAKKNKKGRGARVVIIIDDLDRCQPSYVVEILEGIQTLFHKGKVVFIVAADQKWLHACFEEYYQKLKSKVQEPGKGLGTLFLEKVFQFVVPMPAIPEKISKAYWHDLLKGNNDSASSSEENFRQEVETMVNEMTSENELIQQIKENPAYTFTQNQLIREEVVLRLAAPELAANIENHTLAPFASLLNPNPREMKRLVNSYGVNRALSTLGRLDVPQKELALWTIISMRWPNLAKYLERNPGDIIYFNEEIPPETVLDSSIKHLVTNDEVLRVIKHNNLNIQLTPKIIKNCAMLSM